MLSPKYQEYVDKMLQGDKASLARLISLVEMESPETPGIMELISTHDHSSYLVGITGLAGAGKSTLVNGLIRSFRAQGDAVGVIAVDPSSAKTGGAVLGDRIRMQEHYLDEGVFIRSMATRGYYGGLSKAVRDVAKLMDVSGKDIIFIETTGVGQTETDIVEVADLVILLLVPGFGDSIQLMKAGLTEVADIIVVNKADREGSDVLVNEIRNELTYDPDKRERTIFITVATSNTGIHELYLEIEKRRVANQLSRYKQS